MPKTALLVIDGQVGIIDGPSIGPVYKKELLLKVMKDVIKKAREANVPIIYIQDLDVGKEDLDQQRIHPNISPLPTDTVIRKKSTDAFFNTNLHQLLQERDIRHIVVIGAKTEYCVDTSSRSATVHGYDVTLVADGHSTTDNTVLTAKQIIDHHNCNLHGLDNINNFILVRNSSENIFEHKHLEYK